MRALRERPQIIETNDEPSRARTCDPLVKSQLLYQLSYRPIGGKSNCSLHLCQDAGACW